MHRKRKKKQRNIRRKRNKRDIKRKTGYKEKKEQTKRTLRYNKTIAEDEGTRGGINEGQDRKSFKDSIKELADKSTK